MDLIDSVAEKLADVKDTEGQNSSRESSKGPTDTQLLSKLAANPMASIGQDKIICLECGKPFKMLTERHLMKAHNMTKDYYRTKHDFPSGQALVCTDLSEKRKASAKGRGLGAKPKDVEAAQPHNP